MPRVQRDAAVQHPRRSTRCTTSGALCRCRNLVALTADTTALDGSLVGPTGCSVPVEHPSLAPTRRTEINSVPRASVARTIKYHTSDAVRGARACARAWVPPVYRRIGVHIMHAESESELHWNAPVYPGHCYNFTNLGTAVRVADDCPGVSESSPRIWRTRSSNQLYSTIKLVRYYPNS